MADTTTGLHVKSIATETVRSKLVDAGGTNEATISAAGRVSVDGSGVTQPVSIAATVVVDSELPAAAALTDNFANPTVPGVGGFLMGWDGTNWDRVGVSATGGRLQVDVISGGGSNASVFADNGAFTPDTSSLTVIGGVLNDTAGAALTENDAAAARIDTKRALVFVGEDATTANQKWAISAAGALSGNITQIGGATPSATVFLPTRVTDGTAYYTKTGQTAATASFAQLSDQTTAVGVIAGTTALKTDLSSVAGTATVTAGVAGALGVGGLAAHDVAVSGNPVLMGAASSAAAPADVTADGEAVRVWALRNGSQVVNIAAGGTLWTNMGQAAASGQFVRLTNGTLTATLLDLTNSDPLTVAIVDGTGTQITSFGGGTQYVGDAPATATPTGTVSMGLANAAAPADVSANNDAVAMWMLRNGSPVMNLASGGTLITVGQKVMASSVPVVISSDQSAVAGNLTQVGGSAISATVPVSSRLTDGTAYYTNTGQTAGTSVFSRINDGTTTAGVIAATTALKTDISSIVGAVPAAANPLPVRLTDGASFYSAGSGAPVDPKFSTQTSTALGAGASATLTHYVTSGKTGHLHGVDATSTVAMKVVINTVVTGTPTARVVLFALAGQPIQWRAPYKTYITRASADASSGFSVTITNKDASVAADVYSTGYWDEV